ncbi:MAG: zinc ribbon domain-containing protein [bacterium]
MPLYEFTCRGCGTQFEDLVFSQADVPACPKCGETSVTKDLSVFATSSGAKTPCDMGSCDLPGGRSACPGGSCPFGT